ncbi:hydroxyacylglutathione hydrolase [Pseudoteredinibacter isoporae]|uniref:Hydroxyacylglutathione hydrolase n=1 Tax=Pseudoteredinibacter isoporae TaxID=570281 RepID=A0A7X0MVB7_9GAMM|nr:hydroxyacylglutathione hydrolase [Pseudoteredinibacter isoporae]MBB6521566.1 hydroxyacylglutathione hydrolase [Pseudoteredinibacter isoporae]NHO87120.1 hydroxyacylglutathione hydrolase [Pseudoteredinibacter isoporae]NIB22944.1 hydroxyacylglutathione hydrolase [Pseudoteredinibacter isoporae]
MAYEISPIAAFDDNYIWLIDNGQIAAVVDPGDAKVVLQRLKERELELTAIINTHHHYDHTGGIAELCETFPGCTVYGPVSQPLSQHHCQQDDDVEILPGLNFKVLEVPGHTLDHIAFYSNDLSPSVLFCGDTLFAGGCGRMFEGNPEQMQSSLERLGSLPGETLVYCAHEYTLGNLNFALAVEPGNQDLVQRMEETKALREKSEATVPSVLSTERATNPFMRCREADIQKAASQRAKNIVSNPAETFAILRKWKDNF